MLNYPSTYQRYRTTLSAIENVGALFSLGEIQFAMMSEYSLIVPVLSHHSSNSLLHHSNCGAKRKRVL